MKTRMIIVAAPSGAGKSSFVERICQEDPRLEDTVTYTTREMRQGESEGHPYHFVSREKFEQLIQNNFFIEWAKVHNNLYGTPQEQIEGAFQRNKVVIMDVDVQGVATFKAKYPDATTIFILPPSIEELRRRVMKRDGARLKDLDVRMENAKLEMARADEFDHKIINDEFESSYAKFKKIVEGLIG